MLVGNAFISALIEVLYAILDFYMWVLIIGAVLSWLVALNVVKPYNRFVQILGDMYTRLTEPLLKHIRRVIPPINGLDLSPLVLIFIIIFLQRFIIRL